MPRGRPPGTKNKSKATSQAANLLRAIEFIGVAADSTINDYAKFVRLSNKMAVAFNGQIAAGFPIEEELSLCPHYDRLKIALSKCGASLVITETPANRLSVKGEKLNALVECELAENLPNIYPDQNIIPLQGEALKEAFKACGVLASESETEHVMCASLLLEAYQCTGTNRKAVVQYYHGINLPPHMVLPKIFCAAVAKVVAPIVGMGFSWQDDTQEKVGSVTFWFEGGFWLKTICYADKWMDVNRFFDNAETFPIDIPKDFFEAIDIISNFSDEGYVVFVDGKVQSDLSADVGAQYEVEGLPGGKQFPGKMLKQLAPGMTKIDLTTHPDRVFFFGNNVRGVCTAIINGTN